MEYDRVQKLKLLCSFLFLYLIRRAVLLRHWEREALRRTEAPGFGIGLVAEGSSGRWVEAGPWRGEKERRNDLSRCWERGGMHFLLP